MPTALLLAALALGAAPVDGETSRERGDTNEAATAIGLCVGTELTAACACLGSPLLIGFGLATLGIAPVFANVPLPIGLCGIGLGLVGLVWGTATAIAAPIRLLDTLAAPAQVGALEPGSDEHAMAW